jgi:hypothetical protein
MQSFSYPSPVELRPHFTVSDLRLHQPRGPGPHVYIPQGLEGPVIPPGTGFPLCSLLLLACLWWWHSTLPPHKFQLTLTNCSAYNISAWTTQKTLFNYCCAVVAMEMCLFAKPLLINSCCISASFTVIA